MRLVAHSFGFCGFLTKLNSKGSSKSPLAKPQPWDSRRIFALIAWISKNLLKWD
ncbi:hypothetical protein [Mesomycoplasma ovipneumoniae]|uniref:hypothetical protein n=1 Tax=Mesomycoplasma ovipneumoniae TaxID=29562 RepID=UPI0030805ED0